MRTTRLYLSAFLRHAARWCGVCVCARPILINQAHEDADVADVLREAALMFAQRAETHQDTALSTLSTELRGIVDSFNDEVSDKGDGKALSW